MATKGTPWVDEINAWEQQMKRAVRRHQDDFEHQKCALQLHMETKPVRLLLTLLYWIRALMLSSETHLRVQQLQFHPSPVLMQLIQGDKYRNITAKSAKHHKHKTKNAEYLERKARVVFFIPMGPPGLPLGVVHRLTTYPRCVFVTQLESEIRQHYELENAQSCAMWKQFHLQRTEAHSELAQRIDSEYKQLCKQVGVSAESLLTLTAETAQSSHTGEPHQPSSNSQPNQSELDLRMELASDWVQQERFNIQEAFTNQTKKIQSDFQSFMEQLDREFELEREQILRSGSADVAEGSTSIGVVRMRPAAKAGHELDRQFQSNTKRDMLVHTAPVVDPRASILRQRKSSGSSKHRKTDVSETQQRLDRLQEQLQAAKEIAESKHKQAMIWISRQCAHLFSQLDCKETEAELLLLIQQQHARESRQLLARVTALTTKLRERCDAELTQ